MAAKTDTPTDEREKSSIEELLAGDPVEGKEVATRSSSPEDSSSETPPMNEPMNDPRPLLLLFLEMLHAIRLAIADLYTSSKNFVNISTVVGDKNKTKFRGEGNKSTVKGNQNEYNGDSRSQNVWIVAIVVIAFVAYKALGR